MLPFFHLFFFCVCFCLLGALCKNEVLIEASTLNDPDNHLSYYGRMCVASTGNKLDFGHNRYPFYATFFLVGLSIAGRQVFVRGTGRSGVAVSM